MPIAMKGGGGEESVRCVAPAAGADAGAAAGAATAAVAAAGALPLGAALPQGQGLREGEELWQLQRAPARGGARAQAQSQAPQ